MKLPIRFHCLIEERVHLEILQIMTLLQKTKPGDYAYLKHPLVLLPSSPDTV